MKRIFLLFLSTFLLQFTTKAQATSHQISIQIKVDQSRSENLEETGRLFIFLSTDSIREPRTQTWPNPRSKTFIFAKNETSMSASKPLKFKGSEEWIGTPEWMLDEVPSGEYFIQALWDQNTSESNINAPGNIYSSKEKMTINGPVLLDFKLDQVVEDRTVTKHPLARVVDIKSTVLTNWWSKEMRLKATVLLPFDYDQGKEYPIRYNVAGYGGRYDRINWLLGSESFMSWWDSKAAPQIINVFLDGEGPFGDSYQMDSDNSGPYGNALINELIPHIEKEYRGNSSASERFVDGCSTGGWVSLGLQLYYPDEFSGVFSYSPDAIAFENYNNMNIYKDQNAFVNEYNYERPIMRDVLGEPMLSLREFIQYENVQGTSNTYLNSGGQFSAHNALYGPKGENDLPKPLFDPQTGIFDHEVAEHWKKYDLTLYAKKNWAELGPKLAGKIYIWMGDMDNFYLNSGTREFDEFIESTTSPKSDAIIEFSPMKGHCDEFSHREVLSKIQKVIDNRAK